MYHIYAAELLAGRFDVDRGIGASVMLMVSSDDAAVVIKMLQGARRLAMAIS